MGAKVPCCHARPSERGVDGPPPPQSSMRPGKIVTVMKKYRMFMEADDLMGEGTSSICRKGSTMDNSQILAIKVYKKNKSSGDKVTMQKFVRQIKVLQDLQEAMTPPSNERLWSEYLAPVSPSTLFMQLIDYSKEKNGQPGRDPDDSALYVITELGSYSMKDYIHLRSQQDKPMSRETVRTITKAIILATAGLHAKGLVHLDMKPENLMLFGGVLKLIDVDGCVQLGTVASINDSSLSFSPCYCAPEWAAFLIDDADAPTIGIDPALDVWSIGMTLCELVLLGAMLKPMYASFLRHGRSHREAGFHFMDWLSSAKAVELPQKLVSFDEQFTDLLTGWLLVCDPSSRRTLAEALSHPFVLKANKASLRKASTGPIQAIGELPDLNQLGMPATAPRRRRMRQEDVSDLNAGELHAGTLWKLNTGGNPEDASHWLKRDMWITLNGSLCYWSIKQNMRLVLLDAHHIHTAKISAFNKGSYAHAFMVETDPDHDDHQDGEKDVAIFGCNGAEELATWMHKLEKVKTDAIATMRFSKNMCHELREFKLAVKNRRMKVEDGSADQHAPAFRARLWKVKADGDRMSTADWFERDMWLAKNGSLVYWSKKEDKQLVYYTHDDLAGAILSRIPSDQSCRPFGFQVRLAAKDGIEFAPGDFAAESEEMCEQWINELKLRGATFGSEKASIANRRRSLV